MGRQKLLLGESLRRFQSIAMLLSAIIGLLVVVLVSTFAYLALGAYHREERARLVLAEVDDARTLMTAKVEMRGELAIANLVLEAPEAVDSKAIAQLIRQHANADTMLNLVMGEAARRGLKDSESNLPVLRQAVRDYRTLFRHQVLAAIRLPREQRDPKLFDEWKRVTTVISRRLATLSGILGQDIAGTDPFIDEMMKVGDIAWTMRMDAGICPTASVNAYRATENRSKLRFDDILNRSSTGLTLPPRKSRTVVGTDAFPSLKGRALEHGIRSRLDRGRAGFQLSSSSSTFGGIKWDCF